MAGIAADFQMDPSHTFKAKVWNFEAKVEAVCPELIKFGIEAPQGQGLASRTT